MDNVIVGGVGRFIDGVVKQHHCGGVLPGFVSSTAANKNMAGNLPSFRRRTILSREAALPRIQKCKSMLEPELQNVKDMAERYIYVKISKSWG